MNIGIVGATGFAGADLIRILQAHPQVDDLRLYSSSKTDEYIQKFFPHLQRFQADQLSAIDPAVISQEVDVVMMATPPGVSSTLTPQLITAGLRVVDLSGDFRIKDTSQYEAWYQKEPADDRWLQTAVYGLTEWAREDVRHASLLSNPGCYPTAVLLGALPLLEASFVDVDSLIVDAKTGVSGAGKGYSTATHFSDTNENFKIYKANQHKHTPEIEQELRHMAGDMPPLTFTPHLVPMTRGIMATMYMKVKNGVTEKDIEKALTKRYEKEPFVTVRPQGDFPATKEVLGSNQCDIGFTFDERTGRITLAVVIDNLMKGASGQAVQNLNLMMGWDETAGLNMLPVFP